MAWHAGPRGEHRDDRVADDRSDLPSLLPCFSLASGTASFVNGTANRGWIVDGSSAQARFKCTAGLGGGCIGDVNFRARGIGQSSSAVPSPGPVTSLDVIATGTATERDTVWAIYNDGAIGTETKLYLPGSETALCGSFFQYSPDSMIPGRQVRLAYGLLSTESDPIAGLVPCRSVQIDRQQLRGAGIDLKVSAYRSVPIVNDVNIGFDNTANPHVPVSGTLQAAGVVITGSTSSTEWVTDRGVFDVAQSPTVDRYSTISVRISNLRGIAGSWTASWPNVPFWGQGLYLDLLDPAVAGTCNSVLTNSGAADRGNGRRDGVPAAERHPGLLR